VQLAQFGFFVVQAEAPPQPVLFAGLPLVDAEEYHDLGVEQNHD
jgi:hypothetical protein